MKMKKLLWMMVVAACAVVHGAEVESTDPVAPFDDYGPAMASDAAHPMAVEWHNVHAAELKEAVSDATLTAFVTDADAAGKILAKVTKAYETDALVSIQIAAVSQWVMMPKREAQRKVWVQALMSRIESTDDSYVKEFCLDQLRWCGCSCPKLVERIKAVESTTKDKAVKDLAGIVLREIAGKGIGQ